MIYVVYRYRDIDRVTVCQQVHEADLLLEQIKADQDGAEPLGYMDENHTVQLYKDESPADTVPRIKKVAEDYISSHS